MFDSFLKTPTAMCSNTHMISVINFINFKKLNQSFHLSKVFLIKKKKKIDYKIDYYKQKNVTKFSFLLQELFISKKMLNYDCLYEMIAKSFHINNSMTVKTFRKTPSSVLLLLLFVFTQFIIESTNATETITTNMNIHRPVIDIQLLKNFKHSMNVIIVSSNNAKLNISPYKHRTLLNIQQKQHSYEKISNHSYHDHRLSKIIFSPEKRFRENTSQRSHEQSTQVTPSFLFISNVTSSSSPSSSSSSTSTSSSSSSSSSSQLPLTSSFYHSFSHRFLLSIANSIVLSLRKGNKTSIKKHRSIRSHEDILPETTLQRSIDNSINNKNQPLSKNINLSSSSLPSSSSISSVSANSNNSSSEDIYNQEWNIHLFWYSVFAIMIIIGLLGNVLIIATITGHKSLHTVTNVFLLNLTTSDLVTLLFNATFNLVFMLHGHWPFGHLFCVVNNFMTNLTLALSVFTIMFTSKERYNAIVHPLRKRMTKHRAIIHIILIWVAGTLFASPTLIYSRTIHSRHSNEQRSVCVIKWPDGYPGQSQIDFIYNLLFLVLLYLLPLMTMGIAYTLMARVLWGSKQIGESSQAQLNLIRSKQKVVRMLIYVVVVFGVCWLPYHLYFLTTHYWFQVVSIPHIQQIYLGIYWLAMSNSMLNPIILLVMNQRFRRYSIKFLNFWPCNQMFPFISRASQSLPSEALNTAIVCQGSNLDTQTVLVCCNKSHQHLPIDRSRSSQRNGKTSHVKLNQLRSTQSCRTSSGTDLAVTNRKQTHRNGHHQNGS